MAHERDNDRGRFEVHRDLAASGAKRWREHARRQCRNEAVDVGDPGAQRDQGEHVEAPGEDRPPAALEERPAAPQYRRRGEDQLDPNRGARGQQRSAENILGHRQSDERDRQREADPETAGHVVELGIACLAPDRRHRLERHAADGTASGLAAHDLRVHRAGPAGLADGRTRQGGGRRRQI